MTSRLISQFRGTRHLFRLSDVLGVKANLINGNNGIFQKGLHLSQADLYAAMQIKMPALSPTMTEGTILKWHKKEGDKISPGDILVEVQTDKAVIPYELEEEGIMAKILAVENSPAVKIGSVIGIMVSPGEDWKNVTVPNIAASSESKTQVGKDAPQQAESAPTSSSPPTSQHSSNNLKISPVARMLINSYNINASTIKSTGPHGFMTKNDVKEHINKHNLKPVEHHGTQSQQQEQSQTVTKSKGEQVAKKKTSTPEMDDYSKPQIDFEDIELSNMRKVIAKRLLLSKSTIPHTYLRLNCEVDKITNLRKEMIKNNQKVSINDFLIKAVALSLKLVPELNSNQDEASGNYKNLSTVDISVAVATDKGLITPIVKNADKLSVQTISDQVKILADKAKQNKLMPHEFQGGSFSISNLGMFGISEFSAIINPPQVGILAVGKSELKLGEDMKPHMEMILTLCYDERCASLDRAIKFLNYIKYFVANPSLLQEQLQTF